MDDGDGPGGGGQRAALVTGCSRGIGYETALALARGGYRTFATMRDTAGGGGAALAEAAGKEGLLLEVLELDVDSDGSVRGAVSDAVGRAGRLDVVVNNAGYGQLGCAEDVSVDEFKRQFETNFFGVVRMVHAVAPVMRRQGSGLIVNISSVAGRIGLPGSSAYISSKFAMEGLGECLRYELGRFGVRTTLVEPGVIKTGFFDAMRVPESSVDPGYKEMTDGIIAGLRMMVGMGTEPAEVASVVMRAVRDGDDVRPRYTAGADAAMFMEARGSKTDEEFERYMSQELFPGRSAGEDGGSAG